MIRNRNPDYGGVSEANLSGAHAICDPGDEVIVPQPCFVSYAPEVIFTGGRQ